MKIDEILERMNLEDKHFDLKKLKVPIVEPGLYNTFGRRLFDIYQKYEVSEDEQREIESICFLLTSFVLHRGD